MIKLLKTASNKFPGTKVSIILKLPPNMPNGICIN